MTKKIILVAISIIALHLLGCSMPNSNVEGDFINEPSSLSRNETGLSSSRLSITQEPHENLNEYNGKWYIQFAKDDGNFTIGELSANGYGTDLFFEGDLIRSAYNYGDRDRLTSCTESGTYSYEWVDYSGWNDFDYLPRDYPMEIIVCIDETEPQIEKITTTKLQNGSIDVSALAIDNESGIWFTEYKINSGSWIEGNIVNVTSNCTVSFRAFNYSEECSYSEVKSESIYF